MLIEPAPSTCQVDRYRPKYSYILGGSHITLGVISIILNVVGLGLVPTVIYYFGIRTSFDVQHGIWSGIFVSTIGLIIKKKVLCIYLHRLYITWAIHTCNK